jgi:aspartate-semialdehyde dehydrogenase
MINETKKILDETIEVSPTCVRVPILNCHSESVNIEFDKHMTAEQARKLLSQAPGVIVMDDYQNNVFATPAELSGTDAAYVSRIREDQSIAHGLSL